jgi:hypothetical protein
VCENPDRNHDAEYEARQHPLVLFEVENFGEVHAEAPVLGRPNTAHGLLDRPQTPVKVDLVAVIDLLVAE